MIGILALAALLQLPVPQPGSVVHLANWDRRGGDLAVTVKAISAGPVAWVDAAGTTHNAVTITYVDPGRGPLVTTLPWFMKHVRPVLAPVGPPVPIRDLDIPVTGTAYAPASNQEIKDGVARPADVLYYLPKRVDYYSAFTSKTGVKVGQ